MPERLHVDRGRAAAQTTRTPANFCRVHCIDRRILGARPAMHAIKAWQAGRRAEKTFAYIESEKLDGDVSCLGTLKTKSSGGRARGFTKRGRRGEPRLRLPRSRVMRSCLLANGRVDEAQSEARRVKIDNLLPEEKQLLDGLPYD